MASPTTIKLSINDTGVVRKFGPQDQETADKTSALLQKNHDNFHIYFNNAGYHNHIAHHLLSLYALGAPADVIVKQYSINASYQLPAVPIHLSNVEDMADPEKFQTFLGKNDRYHDFLIFFQQELEKKGTGNVIHEYLFAGNARSDDLLVRLFGGFLHPLIHLGFGLEFNQPSIVAEGLAEAATHDNWMGPFLLGAERAAISKGPSRKSLPSLLDEIRQDEKLSSAADWNDGNKIRDGILRRAPEEAIKYASEWTVTEELLDQKTVEMINTVIYYTAAAQHPPKQVKFDFYFMHCVNASIFWSTFNKLPYLSTKDKIRLLEWKGRNDLVMYASRRSPQLLLEEITGYIPKELEAGGGEQKGLTRRLFKLDDDGHAIKLLRAVIHGEEVSANYEEEEWCKIRGYMWLKIENMIVDSVEDSGEKWARGVGFEEAWKDFKDRPRQVHI